MTIPISIERDLTNDYIKTMLKKHNCLFSSRDKKEELKEKLIKLKQSNRISESEWDTFLAETYKYGSNRIILCNVINVRPTNPINSRRSLESL